MSQAKKTPRRKVVCATMKNKKIKNRGNHACCLRVTPYRCTQPSCAPCTLNKAYPKVPLPHCTGRTVAHNHPACLVHSSTDTALYRQNRCTQPSCTYVLYTQQNIPKSTATAPHCAGTTVAHNHRVCLAHSTNHTQKYRYRTVQAYTTLGGNIRTGWTLI